MVDGECEAAVGGPCREEVEGSEIWRGVICRVCKLNVKEGFISFKYKDKVVDPGLRASFIKV